MFEPIWARLTILVYCNTLGVIITYEHYTMPCEVLRPEGRAGRNEHGEQSNELIRSRGFREHRRIMSRELLRHEERDGRNDNGEH